MSTFESVYFPSHSYACLLSAAILCNQVKISEYAAVYYGDSPVCNMVAETISMNHLWGNYDRITF
jgi:hypothetical protein